MKKMPRWIQIFARFGKYVCIFEFQMIAILCCEHNFFPRVIHILFTNVSPSFLSIFPFSFLVFVCFVLFLNNQLIPIDEIAIMDYGIQVLIRSFDEERTCQSSNHLTTNSFDRFFFLHFLLRIQTISNYRLNTFGDGFNYL